MMYTKGPEGQKNGAKARKLATAPYIVSPW